MGGGDRGRESVCVSVSVCVCACACACACACICVCVCVCEREKGVGGCSVSHMNKVIKQIRSPISTYLIDEHECVIKMVVLKN